MIIETNVMIFAFPVKWLVMFLENSIMFSKPNVMLFLLFRIFLPRLEFTLGYGAIFVLKRRITKMAPQGAIPNYLKPKGYKLLVLTVPFSFVTYM
jgi:hypothetical protein